MVTTSHTRESDDDDNSRPFDEHQEDEWNQAFFNIAVKTQAPGPVDEPPLDATSLEEYHKLQEHQKRWIQMQQQPQTFPTRPLPKQRLPQEQAISQTSKNHGTQKAQWWKKLFCWLT